MSNIVIRQCKVVCVIAIRQCKVVSVKLQDSIQCKDAKCEVVRVDVSWL